MDYTNKLTVKHWSSEDQPREKLLKLGSKALSNAELLAIMLTTGSAKENVVDLSKRILLEVNGDLDKLGKLAVSELLNFHGIGNAKALIIAAAMELGSRRKFFEVDEKPKIRTPEDIFRIFFPLLSDLPHEEFWVAFLNRQNQVMHKLKVSQGGTSSTVVDVKLIAKPALELLASGVIAVHNHPSGNMNASNEDIQLTKKLKIGLSTLDIQLLDHLIIGGGTYLSLANQDLI